MAKALRFSEDQLRELMSRGHRAHRAAAQLAKHVDAELERKIRAANGDIEAIFQLQLLDVSWPALGEPRFQHPPIEGRKFRLDVAFPFLLSRRYIGIEVQGHVHRIKHQFLRDMERHNLLTEAGWAMYYVSGDMVRDGRAAALAERVVRREHC